MKNKMGIAYQYEKPDCHITKTVKITLNSSVRVGWKVNFAWL